MTSVEPEWPEGPTLLLLPDGRRILGRGLRSDPIPHPPPQFGLYALGRRPPPTEWAQRWVPWRDFGLPYDRSQFIDAVMEAHTRAPDERVEVACGGGRGRTGTVLACLCILSGIPAAEAAAYVRAHYHRRAVETPWQRRLVRRFTP